MKTRLYPVLLQQLLERAARVVFSNDRQQGHVGAEHGGIARYVSRSSRPLIGFLPIYLHDKHWRFVRNFDGITKPVPVEHHVAHDEDARFM